MNVFVSHIWGIWNIEVRLDGPTMNARPIMLLMVLSLLLMVGTSGFGDGLHVGPLRVCASDGFPMWVVDGFGRNVSIGRVPMRVVSLSPSSTEILFALSAGSRVVGVTRYCDYPPEVLVRIGDGSLKVVGGFTDPNVEVIVSLRPDLILVSSDLQEDVISNLEGKGLTVFGLASTTIDEIMENVRMVGRILGMAESAESLTQSMTMRIDAVTSQTRQVADRPRVYYEVWYDPLMSVGQGTYLNDLIALAGGANIFSGSTAPYPVVNSETVIDADPQIIVVAKGYMGAIEKTRSKIKDRLGWSSISAVRNDRIYEIDEDILYRQGPRIVDGLETLVSIVHPELFFETGVRSLVLSTSPLVQGVVFEIDGIFERTDSSGVISLVLEKGVHMVKMLNNSVTIGSDKLGFLGWTGAASGKNGSVSIRLDSDSTLTANYYYTTTTLPLEPRHQLNYALVVAAMAVVVAAALLVFGLRSRHREAIDHK